MQTLPYDEASNAAKLRQLPPRLRVLFALLSTFRILPNYSRFHTRTGRGDPGALGALLERLWRDLKGDQMTPDELRLSVDRALQLIPREYDGWDEETQPYAEDAAAALAYTLRAQRTGDPQEAAWASRRVYEAADRFALAQTRVYPNGPAEELAALSHPVVQRELARQQRDLMELMELAASDCADTRLDELRLRSEQEAGDFFRTATA